MKKSLVVGVVVALIISLFCPSVACAVAVQKGNEIVLSIEDAREIIADNNALVAELEATNMALEEEREKTAELIEKIEQYIKAAEEERKLYQKKLVAEKQRETVKIIGVLIIGAVIGAACK